MKTLKELGSTLIHPGPITTLLLIKTITLTATYCTIMWWPPASSLSGLFWMIVFFSFSGLTFYNFLAAMSVGPGNVPAYWKPDDTQDCDKVQFCNICEAYKTPRAHHCRKCGKCVLKMDHHCPWINECVGHHNHAHFVAFLISAVFGCSQASISIACSLYHALFRNYYIHYHLTDAPIVYLGSFYGLVWCLFILGCAFGVALGVGVLLVYQLKCILSNRTSIEEWIEEKGEHRRKVDPSLPPYEHPYSFGWKANWWLVMNIKCEPEGDGIEWPVIPSCNKYSLTVEQIEQKREKKKRVQEVIVVKDYNGSWFPITMGFCLACHPPCSDETRIAIVKDEKILVSRWKKYWLYGEKNIDNDDEGVVEVKGWFPRRCVTAQRIHRPTCHNYKGETACGHEQNNWNGEGANSAESSNEIFNAMSNAGEGEGDSYLRNHSLESDDKKEK